MDFIQSKGHDTNENSAENLEIISTHDVVELEQRFEYDTNITICLCFNSLSTALLSCCRVNTRLTYSY